MMTNQELIERAREWMTQAGHVQGWMQAKELVPLMAEALEAAERENAEAWKEARTAGEGVGCLPCEGTSLSGLICGTGDIVAERIEKLEAENAKLAEQLADEERAHLITIDQREHHEGSINEIALSLGFTEYEREWSNVNDVGRRCVDFIDALTQLAQSLIPGATVEQVLERAKVWREALEPFSELWLARPRTGAITGPNDSYSAAVTWSSDEEMYRRAAEALRPAGEETRVKNPPSGMDGICDD